MASSLSCSNLSASNRLLRKGKRQGKVSLVKVLAAQALLVLRHCHDCRVSERGFRCPRTFQQPGMLDHFWTHKLVVSLYLCKPLCFFLCLSVAVCKTTFFSPIRKNKLVFPGHIGKIREQLVPASVSGMQGQESLSHVCMSASFCTVCEEHIAL